MVISLKTSINNVNGENNQVHMHHAAGNGDNFIRNGVMPAPKTIQAPY